MDIMKHHIGVANRISQEDLFLALFRQPMDLDHNYSHWGWWEFTKKAMHFCRNHTKCFIVLCKEGRRGKYSYCVAREESDLRDYRNILNDNIGKMRKMMAKGQIAVEEKWYKELWQIEAPKGKVEKVEAKQSIVQRLLNPTQVKESA
jgi:hypothetical protein